MLIQPSAVALFFQFCRYLKTFRQVTRDFFRSSAFEALCQPHPFASNWKRGGMEVPGIKTHRGVVLKLNRFIPPVWLSVTEKYLIGCRQLSSNDLQTSSRQAAGGEACRTRAPTTVPLAALATGAERQRLLLCGAPTPEIVFPGFHSCPPPWRVKT